MVFFLEMTDLSMSNWQIYFLAMTTNVTIVYLRGLPKEAISIIL